MGLTSKIALRNLFRHKSRSFSIGFVLFTGAFLMSLGNGTIAGLNKNLERNLVKGFAGDITLMSMEKKLDSITGNSERLGYLEKFKEIKSILVKKKYIERVTPLIIGDAYMLDLSMGQDQSSGFEALGFLGIDSGSYINIYGNSIEIVEGSPLKKGERGILVNTKLRERIYNMHDVWVLPMDGAIRKDNLSPEALDAVDTLKTRNDLVLMGMNGSITATDVRVPIKGIFKYINMNEMLNRYNIMDIETSRECMGYLSTEEMVTNLSEEKRILLDAIDKNPESMVFDDEILKLDETGDAETDYSAMLKEKSKNPNMVDSGIYSIAQINLDPNVNLEQAVRDLNETFLKAGVNEYVRAVSWKDAWSGFHGYAKIQKTSLMVFVYIVYFAAVLMMANALSMAALERTTEIGTMRTVGSGKGFIARMFVTETSFLSFIFGGLGITAGIAAIKILSGMGLTSTSMSLQTLFGGSQYCPYLDIRGIIKGIFQLAILSMIAAIYPVIVAKRIKPLDAIKRN